MFRKALHYCTTACALLLSGTTMAQLPDLSFARRITSTSGVTINDMARDASGNTYVTGYAFGTVSFNPDDPSPTTFTSAGGSTFVMKYLPTGAFAWGFDLPLNGSVSKIGVGPDGMVYLSAIIQGTGIDIDPSSSTNNVSSNGAEDLLLAKYDGTLSPSSPSFFKWGTVIGGSSSEQLRGMFVDDNSIIYVSMQMASTSLDADPSSNTATVTGNGFFCDFVGKYDGTQVPTSTSFHKWSFSLRGASNVLGGPVVADAAGNVYIATRFFGATMDADPSATTVTLSKTASQYDPVLIKFDGTLLPSSTSFHKWSFVLTGSTSNDEIADIALDGKGYLYATGYADGGIDLDPSANTGNPASNAGQEVIAMKYDLSTIPSNTSFYKWGFGIASASSDQGRAISADTSGMVYLSGVIGGTADADPSSNTSNISSLGSYDLFAAKYDGTQLPGSASFYQWAFSMGSASQDEVISMAADNAGNMAMAGYFIGTIDFDPGAGIVNMTSSTGGSGQAGFVTLYTPLHTWTGATGTDWSAAGNWSPPTVPELYQNVLVPGSLGNYPVINVGTAKSRNLIINPGASVTVSGGTLQLAGTLTNNGSFTNSSGTLTLNGATAQSLPGLSLANLAVNNTAGVTLGGNVSITGNVTFSNGIVTLGSNNLSANTATSGSATAYAKTNGSGALKLAVGASNVLFPVGNSSYNPATLNNAGTADNYAVRVTDNMLTGGTSGGTVTNPVVNRTWHIAEDVPLGSDVTLTLQWAAAQEINSFDENHVYVVHHDGAKWHDYLGSQQPYQQPAATPQGGSFTVSQSGITSFSPFGIASDGVFPLAIQLLHISAANEGAVNRIQWQTGNEDEGDMLYLERSTDAIRFESIAKVTTKGSNSKYEYTDNTPADGKNYYRLRTTEVSGKEVYSKIVMAEKAAMAGTLTLYPNPATEQINLVWKGETTSAYIADMSGKVLRAVALYKGNNKLDIASLPAGSYRVCYTLAGTVYSTGFSKE